MTNAKHTPTPWITGSMEANSTIKINSFERRGRLEFLARVYVQPDISFNEAKANAAFIVKAVNNHYKLLYALRSLLHAKQHGQGLSEWDRVIEAAEAALAAAEEQ